MTTRFQRLFPANALIGVVHLPPLPGSPGYWGDMASVIHSAQRDAAVLKEAGFDGIIVENFGDAPFYPASVPAITVSAMTRAALAVRDAIGSAGPALGLNVLRNDAASALAIAAVVDAAFIRVNVHTGVMLTDQGLVSGEAHLTLRARASLGLDELAILCDVMVKHAVPLGAPALEDISRDTWLRGGADALIVSGAGTGLATDPARLKVVKGAAPQAPVLVGSGATLDTLPPLLAHADGLIVGTALKKDGLVKNPVDLGRAKAFVAAREALR